MVNPHIATFYARDVIEPFSDIADVPCFLINTPPQVPAHSPPLFWKPPAETVLKNFSYDLGTLGQVFAEISLARLLYPLDITSTAKLRNITSQGYRQGRAPNFVMVFGSDYPLTASGLIAEDAMNVKCWDIGVLVTLLLNFKDTHRFTTQAIFAQNTANLAAISIDDYAPALMQAAHLTCWERWQGTGCEGNAMLPVRFFEKMRSAADAASAVGSDALEAVSRNQLTIAGLDF